MSATTSTPTRSKTGLIFLAFIAFISLGLPDGLFGVAWPSLRKEFELPLDYMGYFLLLVTFGYLTSSFFSGRVISRFGVGGVLAASCFATGASLIGYTLVPHWMGIVGLGLFAGAGAGAIDAGLNTYIASHHGEGLMQWLHASFGVGVTLGPIIMTTGLNQFDSWRFGYVAVGTAQIILAACFALSASMWQQDGHEPTSESEQLLTDYKTPLLETLRYPWTWVSIALFFIYTGIELTLGHWAYTLLTEGRGVESDVAGLWAGGYWGMFTLGRISAGLYAKRIGIHALLQGSLLSALFGALLLWWNPVEVVSLAGIAIIGFAIAPIFPGFVSGTSSRVGAKHAANTIGMQISAAGAGVAVLPSVAGLLARRVSLEALPPYLAGLLLLLFILYTASARRKNASLSTTLVLDTNLGISPMDQVAGVPLENVPSVDTASQNPRA
jgi:fucose permease